MSYFISPPDRYLDTALDAWKWAGLGGRTPILVTAFADVFFTSDEGIAFLDTLDGKIKPVCGTQEELQQILEKREARERYLLSSFVDQAIAEGQILSGSLCYDFKIHPSVGGALSYENVELCDIAIALDLRGQLHERCRHLAPGTRISEIIVETASERKPWWKFF